tara:strand:+ start:836 stop:1258 length:423 start_codon:yes stop_codon:yes gene_type:complete
MTTTTTTTNNHAFNNAKGHIESMVEDFKKVSYLESLNVTTNEEEQEIEQIKESIINSALSVQFRSGWTDNYDQLQIEEFKILLSWGGPALRVIGDLDEYKQCENIKLQFQDWGTYWTDYELTEIEEKSLNWFCNCFYFGG